jgi:hypothetical protein
MRRKIAAGGRASESWDASGAVAAFKERSVRWESCRIVFDYVVAELAAYAGIYAVVGHDISFNVISTTAPPLFSIMACPGGGDTKLLAILPPHSF